MKAERYILVFGFVLVMIFPLVNNVIPFVGRIDSTENRKLTPFPVLSKDDLDSNVKQVENYLVDRLEIRNNAVRVHNKLSVFIFRSSPGNVKAFVGKSGWLFFSGEELKTFTGTEFFKEKELEEIGAEMKRRERLLKEKYNAEMFVAIVPNKANVYPEYVPPHIVRGETGGYGLQMHQYLTSAGIRTIDLFRLEKLKTKYPLYYKTDNHWNDLGALMASNIILTEFGKVNKNMRALETGNEPKVLREKAGDIAKMLTVESEMIDTNYVPALVLTSLQKDQGKYKCTKGFAYPWDFEHTRYTNNDSLPTVLIIRDSFGAKPFKYISERCKKCVTIFDAWHYGLNEEIVAAEKPQIVLYLIVESQLKNLLKYSAK